MWLDLYDCKSIPGSTHAVESELNSNVVVGTIGLTPDEASKLSRPTPPTPKDPDTYPVMIQVFHNIHCLNLMRKAIWREFYPGIIELHPNGSINDDSPSALHIGEHLFLPFALNYPSYFQAIEKSKAFLNQHRSLHKCNSRSADVHRRRYSIDVPPCIR